MITADPLPPLPLPPPPSPHSAGGSTHTLQSMDAAYLTQVICSSGLSKTTDYNLAHTPLK